MTTRNRRNIIVLLLLAVLAFMGCTKSDRSEEAKQLKNELQEMMYKNPEQALARVDSAFSTTPTACRPPTTAEHLVRGFEQEIDVRATRYCFFSGKYAAD